MITIEGGSGNDTVSGLPNTPAKLDGKQGNDFLQGSNAAELLQGSQGSDVEFGGLGGDTFNFTKFAVAGDTDYVGDWLLGRDHLAFGAGVSITAAQFTDAGASFNGLGLANDAKVFDLRLTLHVDDGPKHFDYSVTLVDAVKNTTWHLDQVQAYLEGFGFTGQIQTTSDLG